MSANVIENFLLAIYEKDIKKLSKTGQDLTEYLKSTNVHIENQQIPFFVEGIIPWLHNSNFRVNLYGLETLYLLTKINKKAMASHFNTVISDIIDKLGDQKEQVRDSAQTLLMAFIDEHHNTPQVALEKLLPAFSHRQWHTREQILTAFQNLLKTYGTEHISVSRYVPCICKLLMDQNSQVREQAHNALILIYQHVGERFKMDLKRKNLIPAAKLALLMEKFEEIRDSGHMIAKDSVLTIESVNGENNINGQSNAFDEIDFQQHSCRIPSNSTDYQTYDQEGKNSNNYEDHVTSSDQDTVTSSIVSGALYCGKATKYSLNNNINYNNGILATPHNSNTNNDNNTNQQTSSTAPVNTTNNRSTSVPRNKAGTGVLSRAISTRVVGTTGIHHGPQTPFSASHMKLNSPAPSSAGAMDEESFYESFEDVPKLHITSIVELEDTFNRMREELSTDKTDWNKRNENMRKIRSIVLCSNLTKHKEYAECMANNLKALEPAFMLALRDLRSQIVREVCITIGFLSQTFGMRWEHGAENLFAQLIILIGNTVKIMSTSAVVAIKFIIKHIHSPKLIPILANSLVTSKSREIRRNICEIFDLILHTWDTSVLEKQVTLLHDGIKRGLQDADAEARASSRKAYWGFADHFKDHAEVLIQSLDSGKQRMLRGEISNSSSNNSLYRSQKNVPSSASGLSTIKGTAKSTVKKFQNMSLEDIARGASKQNINKLRANQNFITEDKTLQSKNGSAFFFNLDAGDSNSIDGVDNNAIGNGKESKTSLHLSSMNKNNDLSMPAKQSHSHNHQQIQNNGGVNSNVMLLNSKMRSTSAIDALAAARAKARKNYALISANNANINNNTANVHLNSYNSSTTGLNYINTNAYNRNVRARIDTNLHGSKSNIRIPGNHHTGTSSSFYGSTTRLNSVTGPYRPLTNNGMHYASNALSNHKSSSISQPGSRSNSPTGGRRLYNMYGSIHVQNSAAHNNPHQSGVTNYPSHQKFATVGRKAGVGLRQTPSATNVNTYYNSLKSRKNGMESVQPNMIPNVNNYGNNHNNNQLLGFEDENDIESVHSSSNNSFAYTSSSEKSFPLNSANKINNFNYNNHHNIKTNNTPNRFGQNHSNNSNSKFTLQTCTPPFQRGTSPYSSPFSPFVSPSTMLHNSGPTTDLDSSDIITLLSSANWADRKEGLIHILRYFRSGNRLKPKEIKPVMENFSKMFMDPHSKVFSIFLDALIEFINFHADSLNDWLYILLTKLFTKMGQDLLTSIQTKCQKLLEVIRNSFPPSLQFDYLAKFLTDQTMTPNYKVKIGALHYCTTVVSSISQSDFNLYNESHIKLVDKVITMCNEPKSGEIRKLATFLLIALWECNPATFTMILQKLSKHQHDLAMALVHQYFPPNTHDATYDSNTSVLPSTDNGDLKYNDNGSYMENGGNNFQHNIEVAFNDNGHQNNSLTNHPSRDGQILTPNNFTNLSFNPSSNNVNTNQTLSTNDISVNGGCSDSRKSYVYTPHVKKLILPSHFVASPANNVANMSKICLSNNHNSPSISSNKSNTTPISANCSINLDKNISSYTHKNVNNNNNNNNSNYIHKEHPENVVMPIKMNNNDSFDSSMTMKPNIPPKPKLGHYNNSRNTPSPNYMVQDEYVQISKIPALKKGMSPFNNGSQPHNDSFQSNMSIDSQHSITNTNSHATKMLVIMNGNCNNANLQQGVKHNQSPLNSFRSRDPFDMSMISHQLEDVVNGKDHDFQQTLDKKMRVLQDPNADRSDVIQGLAYIKCLANSIQDKMVWEDVFINVLPTLYNLLRSSKPDDQIKCNTLATLKELVKQNGHFFSSVIFETLDALLAEHVCCPDKSSKEVIRMTEDVGTQLVKVLNPDITIPHILSFINGKYNLCAHESLQNAIKLLNQIIITHSEDDLHLYVQKCVSALIVNCDHAESCVRKCAVFSLVSLYVKYGDRVLPLFEPLAPQKRKILQVYIKRVNDQRTGGGGALNETSHNITLLVNNSNTGTKNSPSHTQTAPFV